MKSLVNLSSTPFRNRRLFWLAILLLFLIPAYFGMRAVETASRLNGEISVQDMKAKSAEAQLKIVNKPVASKISISTEQNKQLVAANELIARRAFSWSELLNDIERSMTPGVRVLRVSVAQIQPKERDEAFDGNDNAATLNLIVIGKNGQDVTTMIDKMHNSGRFKAFPMNRKSVEGTDDIEFELRVEYFPRNSPARSSRISQTAQTEQIGRNEQIEQTGQVAVSTVSSSAPKIAGRK